MPDKSPSYILIAIVLFLILFGLLVLASISTSLSWEEFKNTTYFLKHQLLFALLPGLVACFVAYKIPLSFIKERSLWIYLSNIGVVGLTFLPVVGLELGGSSRWINLGVVAFQPSEFLKISVVLYFAFCLSRMEIKKDLTNLIPFFVVLIPVVVLLYFQPDISTLGLICSTIVLMYFVSGTPVWHSISIVIVGISSLLALIKIAPYRMNRFLVFLNPEIDPMGIGYQLKQSLIAIGSGGVFGRGLGLSRQKFGFIPHPMSDSIFPILAEEAGFIGSIILISLFILFLWKGLKISKASSKKFAQLTAFGLTAWITIQAFINIGSMSGALPLTGIPLPFISYGGSHLIAELTAVGILLNISRNSNS